MKFVGAIILLAFSLVAFCCEAGEMRWNVFDLTDTGSMFYPPLDGQAAGYYGEDITPEIGFFYNRNQQGRITSLSASWTFMNLAPSSSREIISNTTQAMVAATLEAS